MEELNNQERTSSMNEGISDGDMLTVDDFRSEVRVSVNHDVDVDVRGQTRELNVVRALTRREAGAPGQGNELRHTVAVVIGPTLKSGICGILPIHRKPKMIEDEEEAARAATAALRLPQAPLSVPLSVWSVRSRFASSNPRYRVYHDALETLLSGPDRDSYLHDVSKNNPLCLACKNGNAVAIQCLVNAGVDPNAVGEERGNAIHILLRFANKFHHFNPREFHELHICDLKSRILAECVSLLLEAGADPMTLDDIYGTPLHLAAREGYVSVADVLLTCPKYIRLRKPEKESALGPTVLVDVNARDKKGLTPLHRALNEEVAQLLISRGAEVNAADLEGKTPLHTAVWKGRIDVVRLLLSSGAHVNAVDKLGRSALQRAAKKDLEEITQVLIDAGANVNDVGTQGPKALHTAAKCCSLGVARILINSGADVNSVDINGNTALHYASDGSSSNQDEDTPLLRQWRGHGMILEGRSSQQRRLEMARLLISAGSDVKTRNANLQTSLQIASSRKDTAMKEVLLASMLTADA